LDDKDSSAVETGRQLVYFAAERTLMAWIRASLSLMTLGFVLDRFGLILHQFLSPDNVHLFPRIFSQWAGVGMVVLGSVLALLATNSGGGHFCLYSRIPGSRSGGLHVPGSGSLIDRKALR